MLLAADMSHLANGASVVAGGLRIEVCTLASMRAKASSVTVRLTSSVRTANALLFTSAVLCNFSRSVSTGAVVRQVAHVVSWPAIYSTYSLLMQPRSQPEIPILEMAPLDTAGSSSAESEEERARRDFECHVDRNASDKARLEAERSFRESFWGACPVDRPGWDLVATVLANPRWNSLVAALEEEDEVRTGPTLLGRAAQEGHPQATRALLSSWRRKPGTDAQLHPLVLAAGSMNSEALQITSELPATQEELDLALLALAPWGGETDVRLLLDLGGQTHLRDELGLTPLLLACAHRNHSAVRLLVERSDLSARDFEGRGPLWTCAAVRTRPDGPTMRVQATLHMVKNFDELGAIVIRLLLNAGAETSEREPGGVSPLQAAALAMHVETFIALVPHATAEELGQPGEPLPDWLGGEIDPAKLELPPYEALTFSMNLAMRREREYRELSCHIPPALESRERRGL